MKLESRALAIVLSGFFLAFPGNGHAYQVNCGGGPLTASGITSEFGEAREGCGNCLPTRFHAGVDIGGSCGAGNSVSPILGGTFYRANPNCDDINHCAMVIDSATHRFDYIHIDIPGGLSSGTIVSTSTFLGTVQSSQTLHINDVVRVGSVWVRVNPQFAGRLDYVDSWLPAFSTYTVGDIQDKSIILFREGTDPAPSTFLFRDSRFYVSGSVEIMATASSGFDPSSGRLKRRGVYRMGTNATPIRLVVPGSGIAVPTASFPGSNAIEFGFLADKGTDSFDVVPVYFWRKPEADVHLPSNAFVGPIIPQGEERTWDTTGAAEGPYNLCVTIQDHPQPGYNTAQSCVGVWIDNTPPTVALKDTAGAQIDVATSSTTIVVEASDGESGIYSIKLAGGVSYSSTNYVSGVQLTASNTFPDTPPLSDGSYTATVTDLSGNEASVSFITGESRYSVGSA